MRFMARRQLDFCNLGIVSWFVFSIGAGSIRYMVVCAILYYATYLCFADCDGWLGVLPYYQFTGRNRLPGSHGGLPSTCKSVISHGLLSQSIYYISVNCRHYWVY